MVGAFVLLVHVLDSGGGSDAPATTIVRVQVPAGTTSTGQRSKPGHAAVGTKAPRERGGAGLRRRAPPRPPAGRPPGPRPRLRDRPHPRRRPGRPARAPPAARSSRGSATRPNSARPPASRWSRRSPAGSGSRRRNYPTARSAGSPATRAGSAVYWTRYSLHADLAGRSLELRYGHKVVGRWSVTVGGPGTETPPGRYGVTDGVAFDESPYYGCCALALSGHQDHANSRRAGSAATASRSTAPPAASAAPKASAASAPPTRRCASSSPASPWGRRYSSRRSAQPGRGSWRSERKGRSRLVHGPGRLWPWPRRPRGGDPGRRKSRFRRRFRAPLAGRVTPPG